MKAMNNKRYTASEYEEFLCQEIVDCSFQVHQELGPGLLEKIYEVCFCHELSKRNIPFCRQVKLPILYDGLVFDEGLILDVLVDDLLIVEIKAKKDINPVYEAQLLSHVRLAGLHIGFLINFHVALIKDGIRRFSTA